MSDDKLTPAEQRCLRLSYENNRRMPHFPERIYVSFNISRAATIESLNHKGFLTWSAHRGSSYSFTEKARKFVGAQPLTPDANSLAR